MDIQALLNALPQACVLVSPNELKILYANNHSTRLLAVDLDALVGSHLADHMSPPLQKGAVNLWRKGSLWLKIEEQKLELGEEVYLLFTLTKVEPHIDPTWIQNAVELSEVMVHRFRSTLTGIMGFADLLEMEELSESALEDLNAMQTGLRAMRDMLDELDRFRQIPSSNMREYSLFDLLQEVVHSYRNLGEKRIKLLDHSNGLLQIKTDEKLFKEMLSNLIDNAIDALEEETDEIVVSIQNANELTVANSGLPIKPLEVSKIFHPFFTTKAQSLGLGLSRAALIAESMGMYLYLKMNNKQDGVVFSIELVN